MAKVSLLFEDVDNTIAFRADYHGGLDTTSPAHKLSNQVIKFLDDQAAKKQDIQVDTGPTDALQNGGGGETEKPESLLWVPGRH